MADTARPAHPSAAQAVPLYLLCVASFCALDAVLKHLGQSEHPLTVSLGRYVFGLIFALMIWARAGRPRLTKDIWRAHTIRGVFTAITSVTFIWSLTILPIADAVTYFFVGPLLVPLFAAGLLGERLRRTDVLAGIVGFLGSVIALSGGDVAPAAAHNADRYVWGVASIAVSVLTYSIAVVLLRARAERDGSAVIGVVSAFIPAVMIAPGVLAFGSLPAAGALPFYVLMGVFAAVGAWLAAEAFARAEAQQLMPLEFTALPWAALYGFVFFSETPRPQLWAGAAIIIGACLWSGWTNTRAARAAVPTATPP